MQILVKVQSKQRGWLLAGVATAFALIPTASATPSSKLEELRNTLADLAASYEGTLSFEAAQRESKEFSRFEEIVAMAERAAAGNDTLAALNYYEQAAQWPGLDPKLASTLQLQVALYSPGHRSRRASFQAAERYLFSIAALEEERSTEVTALLKSLRPKPSLAQQRAGESFFKLLATLSPAVLNSGEVFQAAAALARSEGSPQSLQTLMARAAAAEYPAVKPLNPAQQIFSSLQEACAREKWDEAAVLAQRFIHDFPHSSDAVAIRQLQPFLALQLGQTDDAAKMLEQAQAELNARTQALAEAESAEAMRTALAELPAPLDLMLFLGALNELRRAERAFLATISTLRSTASFERYLRQIPRPAPVQPILQSLLKIGAELATFEAQLAPANSSLNTLLAAHAEGQARILSKEASFARRAWLPWGMLEKNAALLTQSEEQLNEARSRFAQLYLARQKQGLRLSPLRQQEIMLWEEFAKLGQLQLRTFSVATRYYYSPSEEELDQQQALDLLLKQRKVLARERARNKGSLVASSHDSQLRQAWGQWELLAQRLRNAFTAKKQKQEHSAAELLRRLADYAARLKDQEDQLKKLAAAVEQSEERILPALRKYYEKILAEEARHLSKLSGDKAWAEAVLIRKAEATAREDSRVQRAVHAMEAL